jgi:quinolinate synthase
MINLYKNENEQYLPPVSSDELSDAQVLEEIAQLKTKLKDQLVILGHHYQQDDIVQFADYLGDSLQLAQDAAKLTQVPHIIFCGVHFMAETADMLTSPKQNVYLPDMRAGCSMADMANLKEVEKCWSFLNQHAGKKIIPVTYINCSAELKAFVGKHGGAICTSSNAAKIISWALQQDAKLLFFPDQHLGRNTCFDLGIKLEDMQTYDPRRQNGGLEISDVQRSQIYLWYGYCSVHQGFKKEHIDALRSNQPETQIIVHPECSFDVVQAADDKGSTSYIIKKITAAPSGSSFAVGTEINLVNRLAQKFPDKKIFSLSPYQCLCTTMYRVRPRWLLSTMRHIQKGDPINIIRVPEEVKKYSLIALNRMLELS